MPGWLKVLLIVLIVIVLLVIGVVGAGVFYVMKNKDAWMARAKEVATEGKNFGRGTDNQGCVDEAIARYKKDPGLTSVVSNSVFVRPCLEASRPTSGFCDDVPKQTEFVKTAHWRLDQCRRVGLGSDSNCQNLFTPVQQFCDQKFSR
ncbi:MAG: hypothetical protein ABR607_11250 [Pyrinomonadaceae bacterium]